MSNELLVERNLLIPMPDGVELAGDVTRPAGIRKVPALLNFNPYHKDGRGGRLDVDATNRHFAARGYAALSVDFRGLGNSGGTNSEPFSPQEALDGHQVVEWIARQDWCDGNVGMWGVSYPGITSISTAATRPPHLKAIVPIHATSDLYRGVVALGGCSTGFWMRADWGPRMLAYNLMPPQLQDSEGRWARIWAEHLESNAPWIAAWNAHPTFDPYWRSRVAPVGRIECPSFNICGWRDLYADCTPRDFAAITAPRKLLMGPWKHEFPDKGKQAPFPGLHDMERWFDRWLKGERNGIDTEAPIALFIQGESGQGEGGLWRAEREWPPRRQETRELFLARDGGLASSGGSGTTRYDYDPTVGMQSLVWDPWTTSLDPGLPRDHSGDDARSLCFTTAPLAEPMELIGVPSALVEVAASALPLHLVVKLSDVAPNGRSTLITTGWIDLATGTRAGARAQVEVALRATAYHLGVGRRLRVSIACADFPRLWPTPKRATLQLFHGASRVRLPVCPPPAGEPAQVKRGPLQAEALASPHDLGGGQEWEIASDLMSDTARMEARKSERVRIDAGTVMSGDHRYGAAVSAARPDLARMHSTTTVAIERATSRVDLVARTVTTSADMAAEVEITIDGQPYWRRSWRC
ncbi:MAG: CocE/NonD family hydrolase [Alphaproteobacteria bacterium]|nr:CocE/NonD family hydrolase [Alphaproteobacteria bacterium]